MDLKYKEAQMKNRIFKKDEKGNYIIDFANINRDYYSLIAHEDKPKLVDMLDEMGDKYEN